MIEDHTVELPDYTDTMSRIVGDYTQMLFPSDCFQSVEPNESNKERISIAFNHTR